MAKLRQFKPHFCHRQQGLPGHSPGMPWPAATYASDRKSIRLIIYIDDILIMAGSKQIARDHLYLTLDILEILGFLVNYPKCILRCTQIIDFLVVLVRDTHIIVWSCSITGLFIVGGWKCEI